MKSRKVKVLMRVVIGFQEVVRGTGVRLGCRVAFSVRSTESTSANAVDSEISGNEQNNEERTGS